MEIWFQDKARAGQQRPHAYLWAPNSSRPLMVRDNRHGSAPISSAIRPQRGVGAALRLSTADAAMMNLHLAEISRQVTSSAIAVLICDGAGWQQTVGALVVPDNIALLHLPPYSLELNPMENVLD